ncbi:hypothetical protein D9758_018370 [Tetrapyrgos nigripes]|uniref:Uncharacterized protein n=1 Tax=Tetrapyrgos nigripes TaxID=182062 RepID=A0A8H5EX92_9AGAR|nr:hypothetical protein D9758_018370 [Tetrapyrgos nigripes]
MYFSWQLLYWKFVLIDCREKIESGQRTTSFSLSSITNAASSVVPSPLSHLNQVAYEFENISGAEERAILKVKDSTEAASYLRLHLFPSHPVQLFETSTSFTTNVNSVPSNTRAESIFWPPWPTQPTKKPTRRGGKT